IVDGRYRFLAGGCAPTRAAAPFMDILEGVRLAVVDVETISRRRILDADGNLMLPTQPDGSGVDRLALTHSAGPPVKVLAAGLLADVSLQSAQNLASSLYSRLVEVISLSDRRRMDEQIDAILKAEPDIVILAGGSEGGASRSIQNLVELLLLALRVMPQDKRPQVLYAGNSALAKPVKETLEKWTGVRTAPNIRPSVDKENLAPAQTILAQSFNRIRVQQLGGFAKLAGISSDNPLPTAHAIGRVARFLSKVYDPRKTILALDLGASHTTLAAANGGRLSLCALPVGMGGGAVEVMRHSRVEDLTRWLPLDIPPDVVRDAIWQKTLYPGALPLTREAMAIEQALARQVLRLALEQTQPAWESFPPALEPILVSGSILSAAPTPGQALLMLLDGLQPVGVTTFILDPNQLIPGLGAVARVNNLLTVQVLDSGAFVHLGTVISPVSRARYGTPVLHARLVTEDGKESRHEVHKGSLVRLPLKPGVPAHLHLTALHGAQIDPYSRSGATANLKVIGGVCGVIIDARGRPLALPQDAARRRDLINKWGAALGG
ncbi:MAG: hypothetical protein HPY76_05655, partial [Anaerolineae bacterium]|nr:hypothetical protein [Anaerolineae bacterium]